jgi:N-carbamoylputrescine amidase
LKSEVKVTAVQFAAEPAVFDPVKKAANIERICTYIERLGPGCDLLVFPELATTGYIPMQGYWPEKKIEFARLAEDPSGNPDLARIQKLVDRTGCTCVFGFPEKARPKYEMYNSAALMEKGQPPRFYHKAHIPVEENHYFIPGNRTTVHSTAMGKIGIAICYDFMFPEMVRVLGVIGAEIIIFILCFPDTGGMKRISEPVVVTRALENQAHVVFCQSAGKLDYAGSPITLAGNSMIVNSRGRVLARAESQDECVIKAVLTEKDLEKGASVFPYFRDRRPELYKPLVEPLD